MDTLGHRLLDTGGRPTGFDYLRIFLAVAVVCQHSMNTTLGMERTVELLNGPLRAPVALILPMFFALSGFLVAGSLLRSRSLIGFAGLRILRIIPALAVEVCVAALLIGPVLTSLSLSDYFTNPKFYSYFLNILGDIHYKLPGLFPNNPIPEIVNGQLWTIPFELKCYIAIAALAFVGIAFHRTAYVTFLVVLQAALIAYLTVKNPEPGPVIRGPILVACFLFGVGFYLWRDKIPYERWIAGATLVVSIALLLVRNGEFLVAAPATYLTCYIGLTNPPKISFLRTGDYSYGVFLYGYPLQQALSSLGHPFWYWWINIAICVPASLFLAYVSWHAVEKHALKLKPALMAVENAILARFKFLGFWLRPSLAG